MVFIFLSFGFFFVSIILLNYLLSLNKNEKLRRFCAYVLPFVVATLFLVLTPISLPKSEIEEKEIIVDDAAPFIQSFRWAISLLVLVPLLVYAQIAMGEAFLNINVLKRNKGH